ncbi:MAG: glycosyltransferase [Woeseiaceae bacterium]
MKVGHINLARSFNGTGEHFVALVEALERQGITQHVIVRNHSLARRVAVYDNVTIGTVTSSPVVALCLMPQVDVVHAHNEKSAQAGLVLTLTRSIPFVMSCRDVTKRSPNPILRSIFSRAAGLICSDAAMAKTLLRGTTRTPVDVIEDITRQDGKDFDMIGNRAAAEHLRIYRRAADTWRVPALLL